MKNHTKILWFMTFHKKLVDSKPLGTRIDKIDEFIRIYNGTRHLTLFGPAIMALFTTELDILEV